ncbi:hypothetical protein CGRA01v4_09869 [Colletotrichum graminicola]|nr:hypothetical protein CGRA01v4_09869 [Colletotrichum graminicola]
MLQHGPDALVEVLDEQDQLDPHQRLPPQRGLVRGLVQALAQAGQDVAQAEGELGRVGADADQGQADVAVPGGGVGGVEVAQDVGDVRDDLCRGRDLGEGGEHVEEALGDLGAEEGLLPGDVEDGDGYGAIEGRVVLERFALIVVYDLVLGQRRQPQSVVVVVVLLIVVVVVELDLVVVVHLLAGQGVLLLGLLLAAAGALLGLHLGQPFHLAAGVLDPQGTLGGAEAAAAHEVAPGAAHVAVGGRAAAGEDPEVGVGGHHAQGAGHGAAPALGGLDFGGIGEVLEPEVLVARVAGDSAFVDGEDAGLGGVLGGDVADLHALAALGAEGIEGLLPLGVGAEVVGVGAGGEDAMLEVTSLLNDCADLILCEYFLFLPFAQLGNGTLQVEAGLLSDGHDYESEDESEGGVVLSFCFSKD